MNATQEDETSHSNSNGSRMELDSHANMVVVGRNCLVVHDSGRKADVSAFTPEHNTLEVPIIDAMLLYDDLFNGKEYGLFVMDALHIPSMEHNLVPPFIMHEAGIMVNDTPKIHVLDQTPDDHAIIFPGGEFCIPLSLWGVFSYFPTRAPMVEQVEGLDEVYMLTPSG